MSDPITHIAIAGGAPVTRENVEDLVKDFLLIDTAEEKVFRIFLPAAPEFVSDAVVHAAAFCVDLDEGYTVVRGAASSRQIGNSLKAKQLARGAEDVLKAEDSVAGSLIEVLAEAKAAGDEAYLFLAWGDGDEAPDDATQELLELATTTGIPVKDLTAGLDDLDFEDEPDSADDDEPDVDEVKSEMRGDEPVKELKPTERELTSADEAQADLPVMIEGSPAIPDLATVLGFVAQKLDFEDRMNAAANMAELRRRPLTEAVRHHLHRLLDEAAGEDSPKAAEPVQDPLPEAGEDKPRPRRGEARDTASDVVKVLINEKDKTARIREGRGRPKKGEESHEMTRAEFQELIDSGDYTPF